MNSSFGVESFFSGQSGGSRGGPRDLHVSGRNKGIREIDLNFALTEPDGSDEALDDSGMSSENAMLLASITSLDLSRNEIERLANLDPLKSLKKLDVSYNLIATVVALPFTLTRLNVSHNRLRNLDGIARLPHLRELDVRANRLVNLAGLNPRMPLQVLRADDNRLVSTLGLEDMPDLRLLTLANNFIEHLDELAFLSNAVSLQSLTLKNNPVTQLNGYRWLLGQRQAALLSLDGAPLLRPRSEADYRQGYSPNPSPHERSSFSQRSETRATAVPLTSSAATHTRTPTSVRGSGAYSATPTVDLTPVQRSPVDARSSALAAHASSRHTAGDSPLFDDSFMRGVYGSSPAGQSNMEAGDAPKAARHPYDASVDAAGVNQSETTASTPLPRRQLGSTAKPATHAVAASPAEGYAGQFARTRATSADLQKTDEGDGEEDPSRASTVRSQGHSPTTTSRVTATTRGKGRTAQHPANVSPSSLSALSTIRKDANATDHRSAAAQLHDCLVAKEQLERENQALRVRLKKSEEQLAESRRIVSGQLGELSNTRIERDALRQAEGDIKERLERARRHGKMMEAHHKEEIAALQEQFTRTKTFYEAQIADLRRQLAAEVARSTARETAAAPRTASPEEIAPLAPPPLLQRAAAAQPSTLPPTVSLPPFPVTPSSTARHRSSAPPRSIERAAAGEPETPAAPVVDSSALAEQLKGWLYAQMADDANRAEQEELYQRLQQSVEAEEQQERGRRSGTDGLIRSQTRGSTVPPEAPDVTRALLEAYVLRQQSPRPSVAHESGEEQRNPEGEKEQSPPAGSVNSPSPATPQKATTPDQPEPPREPGSGGVHGPVEEPFVSRARPSLSPQKQW